jgi:uncharacterized protein
MVCMSRRYNVARCCPGLDPDRAAVLAGRVLAEPWLTRALAAVTASGLPGAWIGAGAIRDVVWGQLHDGFDPAGVRDVDVVFFDAADLSPDRDRAAQAALAAVADYPWEASNQAAVHTWFHRYFGGAPVPPLRTVHEAVATWPETATCVAVRAAGDVLEICAPHGLTDLLDGVWRVNPVRVTPATSRARLARQRPAQRWPRVRVIPPG